MEIVIIKRTVFLFALLVVFSCRTGQEFESLITTIDDLKISEDSQVIVREDVSSENKINMAVHYLVTWSGLHVGDLIIEIKPVTVKSGDGVKESVYRFQAVMSSYGIARFISGFQSNAISIIKPEDEGYLPVNYQTSFSYKAKRRDIKIVYSDDGKNIEKEVNLPPEKKWKRPAVPEDMKIKTFDPVTLAMVARKEIIKRDGDKSLSQEFSLPLYDGRRRSEIYFAINERNKKGYIYITMKEIPIAGYTDNELKEMARRDDTIQIYLSPRNYMPLSGIGSSLIGTTELVAKKRCKDIEECISDL